jgi:ABC-2 type transport system permease protein
MENNNRNLFVQIREGLYSLPRIWMREFQLIFSDWGVMILIFAVPIIYPMLYSFIYYPEVVRDMPVAVVDLSHSADSRLFIRNIDATPDLKVTANSVSMEEAISMFRNRQVRGIIQIPETFSSGIALHRQTTISTYADMEFFLYYKAMLAGTSFVVLETGNQIQIKNLMNDGLTEMQAEVTARPVKFVDNAMANQAGGFASYGIPAALILIIQQTMIIAIGILAGTTRERHVFGTLVPLDRKRMGAFRLVVGKSGAYFTIYALLSVYMLGMIPEWFGYGQSAGLVELIALIAPFILSSIFLGLTLSVIFKNRESAMMIYLFTSIPLLFLSGIIWPLSNFSTIWSIVRDIFPSSNAIFGYIKMNSLGASIFETRKEILTLWIQTGTYFLTACITYGFQVNFSEHLRGKIASLPIKAIRKRMTTEM